MTAASPLAPESSPSKPQANQLPAYKQAELTLYAEIYGSGSDLSQSTSHAGLLQESEEFFLKRLAQLSPNARILEIGCGAGRHAKFAARNGASEVFAIDLSPAAINLAKKLHSSQADSCPVHFMQMDSEKLDFADFSFDLIIDHEVFSSIDLKNALPELLRVLRPGGKLLCLECFAHNPVFNLNRKINARLGKRTFWSINHIFSNRDLELLRKDFDPIEIKHFHLLLILLAPFNKLLPSRAWNKVRMLIQKMDGLILRHFSFFRSLAFKLVIEATRR